MNNQNISITPAEMEVNVRYGKDGNAYGLLVNALINGEEKLFQLTGENGKTYTFKKSMVHKKDLPALEEKVAKLHEFKRAFNRKVQEAVFNDLVRR